MILNWLDASKAVEFGIALADELSRKVGGDPLQENKPKNETPVDALREVLASSDYHRRFTELNFYKKAKLANSFKWRLIENGVERTTADEVTQSLVLNLPSSNDAEEHDRSDGAENNLIAPDQIVKQLLLLGNKCMAQRAYLEAINLFGKILAIDPNHAVALNNLGSALSSLNRFHEAEKFFRSAIRSRPDFGEAHSNLGKVLRWSGYFKDSETSLRQALKLNPTNLDARVGLGMTLALSNRFREATGHFKKVLKKRLRDPEALFGMGQIASMEGRFEESEAIFKQALESSPRMPIAWAALASVRKMTTSDDFWLRTVKDIAAGGVLPPMEAASLHFAMGKYHDDNEEFEQAFKAYSLANELLKPVSQPYLRKDRSTFVDQLMGLCPTKFQTSSAERGSDSTKPVFVVGMMRSGTSLTEQIIASHPLAVGAGEVEYWNMVVREHSAAIHQGINPFDGPEKQRVANGYLHALEKVSTNALRVVDKAPLNSEFLGLINPIFPNARIIYMRRDPIDTCLSCYFQNFSLAHSFTLDLADIAHYYKEHHRLMSHWHRVLPPGSILDVPYEGLVADQEGWTRKILDFIQLDWDPRCMNFEATDRPIVTASFWQARQKIFNTSVRRWRNYKKFVGPLLALEKLSW